MRSSYGESVENRIPKSEVIFHPHSFADPAGRLFRWNDYFYRGINSDRMPLIRTLFRLGIVQELMSKGLLVQTEMTDYVMDDYEMVIRHKKIPFPSYPNEWCAAMLKDAILTFIDLAIELAEKGLTLADANPWNLLIDINNCRPVFVDLGSIVEISQVTWPPYQDFLRYCLYPLILISQGKETIGRLLMCEEEGVSDLDLLQLTGWRAAGIITRVSAFLNRFELACQKKLSLGNLGQIGKFTGFLYHRLEERGGPNPSEPVKRESHLALFRSIKNQVKSVRVLSVPPERWMRGEPVLQTPSSLNEDDTLGLRVIHDILERLRPISVLDIGSRRVCYPKLAAQLQTHLVYFDTDEEIVGWLYSEACRKNLPILPLIMDFAKPTPARGLGNHWSIGAADRFHFEMVLALGSIHRIVYTRRLRPDQIAEGLSAFSTRWALVEYIPRNDPGFDPKWNGYHPSYTLDHVLEALKNQFSSIEKIPYPCHQRTLLLCTK